MAELQRVEINDVDDITVVRFVDKKILDAANIQQLGDELFGLVENDGRKSLVLNFANVEFLSSAALNKLIMLDKKVKASGGSMVFCELRPEIHEVFVITRLTQLFKIKDNERESLDEFKA